MSRVFDMYNFENLLGNSMQSVFHTIPRTEQIFFYKSSAHSRAKQGSMANCHAALQDLVVFF